METMTLEAAVNEIAEAYANLDRAKQDCKDVIESSLDAYFGQFQASSENEYKEIKDNRKIEARNIKKLAKAMMKGAKQEAKEEADNMTELCERLG
jgi:hypothetical protein